jgi:DNA-binding LacI/PurR family transcriptional regulator
MTMTSKKPTSLKRLAEYLGLNPATVSVVLNDTPGRNIPQSTRERVKAAARKFKYQPSLVARSLRNQRTHNIGILVPELSDGYHTQVMTGIGDCLIEKGYFYFTAHHRHRRELVEDYGQMLLNRGAEAIIAIDTALEHSYPVPAVALAGHRAIPGVTNVLLNHRAAAEMTLGHLYSLGHRSFAFLKGQPQSSDSEERWAQWQRAAREMHISINTNLVVELDQSMSSPEVGYPAIQRLLCVGQQFTALVCFNDFSAIGAVRALQDFGLNVPGDVSVIGFDDIQAASFQTPRLTTIRQPLMHMGRIAAEYALKRLHHANGYREEIVIEPELMIRESTARRKV